VSKKMMAAVLYGKEDVRVEKMDVPRPLADEVLVKIEAALTCGTDLKVWRQGFHARMITPPAVFGHELAGVVVEVGDQVDDFRVGQRVVAANSAPCSECHYCHKDLENLCEKLLFNNGAYAEYIRIPGPIVRKNLLEIPKHLSFRDAALVEPLACVLRGLEESNVHRRDYIVVVGLGPIGQMFVRLAKLRGARVLALGRRKSQLDRALQMGADDVLDVTKVSDVVSAVRALTPGGGGVDVAIEAVGTPVTWQWATGMVRKGGTVNFFGGCPSGSMVQLDTVLLHYSEITMKATFHHTPYYIRRALDCIACGDVNAADLVTSEARLADLPNVLRNMQNRNGDLKTAILP
jgi:L-iditol 2-dehydrogenase